MSADWPAWANERVEIVPADPAWPRRAAELGRELDTLLAPWLDAPVEHVGSTAVPGLDAKPTIDLLAPVRSLSSAADADDALTQAGWHLVPPELDQRPWRRMYILPAGDRREAHLHLVESISPQLRDTLAFRDVLRRRPELATDYGRLKREAARGHEHDREAYTRAKTAFVARVISEAGP